MGGNGRLHVALLRAVNVAGHGAVGMGALKELFADLGFPGARTLLASGNVVFAADGKNPAALEALLEAGARKRIGLATEFFVRTAAEWGAVVARNPFTAEAKDDPARLVLLSLKDAPAKGAEQALAAAIVGRERVRVDGRQAYAVYPDGQGRSKLTAAVIERALGTRVTARNWNTVLKLAALVG